MIAVMHLVSVLCLGYSLTVSAYAIRYRSSFSSKDTISMSMPDYVPTSFRVQALTRIQKVARPVLGAVLVAVPQLLSPSLSSADDALAVAAVPTPEAVKKDLGPPPKDFGLVQNDYYADAQKIVNHMRYAVQLEKGNPVISDIAQKTKDEMTDFVSFYRRFGGISGKQSFSLLYTSINVLAGHYTSYGVKIPVPEKRRKRLLQEFNDIEKNIRKKR